jgi:hypothetical protein
MLLLLLLILSKGALNCSAVLIGLIALDRAPGDCIRASESTSCISPLLLLPPLGPAAPPAGALRQMQPPKRVAVHPEVASVRKAGPGSLRCPHDAPCAGLKLPLPGMQAAAGVAAAAVDMHSSLRDVLRHLLAKLGSARRTELVAVLGHCRLSLAVLEGLAQGVSGPGLVMRLFRV